MTQQSVSCIFVIRFELERFRQLPDRSDDRICPLVLQKALLHPRINRLYVLPALLFRLVGAFQPSVAEIYEIILLGHDYI